ncbi:glycosyl hydrolase family 28-related protein [Serratia fonticola]|uniref:glycosyl hydrolase family 28-related protein n=1 Tax=Serratia fonticola TaxID=47917 RepID=UPI00301D6A76
MERRSLLKKSFISIIGFFTMPSFAEKKSNSNLNNENLSVIPNIAPIQNINNIGERISNKEIPLQTFSLNYRHYSVKERLDESLSVKAYGAKGDGKSDDTLAIQSAIDNCTDGTLTFPAGTYIISNTLNISKNSLTLLGTRGYLNGTRIICSIKGMTALLISSYGVRITNIFIDGYENDENENSYGQGTTCIGIKFLRDDNSKDVDSKVDNCLLRFLKIGICGYGSNILISSNLFSSTITSIELSEIEGKDFRGHIINNNRFHKCGGNQQYKRYSELKKSTCIRITGQARAIQIIDNYADSSIYRFFDGQLMRGSMISNNTIYRADSDVIVIDNTSSTNAYETFSCSGNILSNDDSQLDNASGYFICLKSVQGALISNNVGSYIKKGGIKCTHVSNCMFSNNIFKNINTAFIKDGAIYSGIEIDETSSRNLIIGLIIKNTYNIEQCRSAIENNGTLIHINNVLAENAKSILAEGEKAITTGELNENKRNIRIEYRASTPSQGNYQIGDIWYSTEPATFGFIGEICIAAGTPGVWKRFGKIEL